MDLSKQEINECIDRYYRERDRYEKLTKLIEDLCLNALVDERSLQLNVGSRTKRINSFAGKLKRFSAKNEKPSWKSVDDVFNNLSDFSGVRIIYYSGTDLQFIKSGLESVFGKLSYDVKDKRKDGEGFYEATHCQVRVPSSLLVGDNENLIGLEAEIQICSMMSHVWNEIEHDISYKPIGEVSGDESELLRRLGEIKVEGDQIISDLMHMHKQRRSTEDQLNEAEGVVNFLKTTFDIRRDTMSGGAGKLMQVLHHLDITSEKNLRDWMGVKSNMSSVINRELWKQAKAEIERFNRFLESEGRSELALDARNSADPPLC